MNYNVHCTLLFLQCASYTVLFSYVALVIYCIFFTHYFESFCFSLTITDLTFDCFGIGSRRMKDTELGHQVKMGFEGV
jgi:hypothetical protein